jgi:hypothetical protein
MKNKAQWSPGSGMQVVDVERLDGKWLITATGKAFGACPSCSVLSTIRHGRYSRQLQDLLEQGTVGHCHINRKRSRLNEARGLKVDHTAFRAYVSSRQTSKIKERIIR